VESAETPVIIDSPEIAKEFVPLYVSIRKESLDFVKQNGLRVMDNRMKNGAPELEQVFSQTGKEMGIKIDRTSCVFAYPRTPDKVKLSLISNKEKHVLLQVQADPKDCLVADGVYYSEAGWRMSLTNGLEETRAWAKSYWEIAKPLNEYLSERHTGKKSDYDDFEFPEVLIPTDIPPERIKVVENYK
jgi:hemoglobin-like flavoprotein